MGPRSVCLVACCALAVLLPQPSAGQTAVASASSNRSEPTYRLRGVVTDAGREPIADAEVAIIVDGASGKRTVTDARGRFDLGSHPAGLISFRIRRLGYELREQTVTMGVNGQPTSLEIVLLAIPAELEKVYVTTEPQGRLRGFYERRQQRGTFAKFMEQDEIRRMGIPLNASDLLRGVPGVKISTNPNGGNAIRVRDCQPMVLVDGQRLPGAELDEVAVPGDIAAIEFYPSSAGVPAQYLERGNRLCGLILVWTKAK
jgi:carboxypeptidase family protein/TonB-dependent receptor-like protein